ncbi:MAG: DUF6522 family protein [Methylovirgula sp.]
MLKIGFEHEAVQIDATIMAEGFGITPSLLRESMQGGRITSICERGIDRDDGRYRLTFFSDSKRLRFIVDERGNVIQRLRSDLGARRLSVCKAKRSCPSF